MLIENFNLNFNASESFREEGNETDHLTSNVAGDDVISYQDSMMMAIMDSEEEEGTRKLAKSEKSNHEEKEELKKTSFWSEKGDFGGQKWDFNAKGQA